MASALSFECLNAMAAAVSPVSALPQKSKMRPKLIGLEYETYNKLVTKRTFEAKPPSIQPIGGHGGKEIIPLTLDRVFLFRDLNLPPGQFFVHEVHDERVFDGLPAAFGMRGFVLGYLFS